MSSTARERWLDALRHRTPERLPMDYRATAEAHERLKKHLGCADDGELYRRLHIDPIVDLSPRYIGPPIPPDEDIYGIGFQDTDYGTGTYRDAVRFPLESYGSVEEIEERFRWPSADWYDYSVVAQQVKGNEEAVIRAPGSENWDIYRWMRGNERGYLDLYDKPEMVRYCLGKLYDFSYERCRRTLERVPGKVLWVWVAEDVSSQRGLAISLEHIREFLIPHMKRMIDLVHEFGAFAFHHSDGACRENIPNMISIGMDVLDPVQWRCAGMDRGELKRLYGDRISFHGAMDNQHTLAFGSVQDVRKEVEDNIGLLGKDGGYILGPCHSIQVVSPPENIVAMYEAGYELGRR